MGTIKRCAVFRTVEVEMAMKCDIANYHWNQPIAIKMKDMYKNRKKQSDDDHNQLIETTKETRAQEIGLIRKEFLRTKIDGRIKFKNTFLCSLMSYCLIGFVLTPFITTLRVILNLQMPIIHYNDFSIFCEQLSPARTHLQKFHNASLCETYARQLLFI